jgi:hypothetical protein
MWKKIRALWFLPVLFFCLAFDPPDGKLAGDQGRFYMDKLADTETALLKPVAGTPINGHPFGADPYRIKYLEKFQRYLILLRNSSRILLCDQELRILDSRATPRGPVAWDTWREEILMVGGEFSGILQTYKISSNRIEPISAIPLKGVVSVRDLVFVEDGHTVFALDNFDRRLIRLGLPPNWPETEATQFKQIQFPLGAGPLQIKYVKDHLIINLLLDHVLLIIPIDNGQPDFQHAARIVNDGPFWSFSATLKNDKLVIAAGGIENRPLSRSTGEFGYLDSFLYLFTLDRDEQGRFFWRESHRERPDRFMAVNLSQYNVLMPKVLSFAAPSPDALNLWVSGYGGESIMLFRIGDTQVSPQRQLLLIPGISDFILTRDPTNPAIVFTSPLLDVVASHELKTGRELHVLKPEDPEAHPLGLENRVGETLFYTGLMSPHNSSAGELSRFTCEACHFEGSIDGRVHFSGRGSIHATTKPLGGMANNVPLFSRGGDDSLASMVVAEFAVANQNRNDQFSIKKEDHAWTSKVAAWPQSLSPLDLRVALLTFFANFEHGPNSWRLHNPSFDERAKRGLTVFRDRCSDCHQAVQSTRTESGIPFEEWEEWLLSSDRDLVWGASFFSRVGIKPYVDPAGARVPSLRRVWMKYPLFTNGSSATIRDVLNRFRYQGSSVWHHFEPESSKDKEGVKALTPGEISDLEALLRYF